MQQSAFLKETRLLQMRESESFLLRFCKKEGLAAFDSSFLLSKPV